jgi:DNA-binding CsgD family transcriptional regulator
LNDREGIATSLTYLGSVAWVAAGLTNAEVAERLFLSSRTVDWHLGSIYRKLGIHSRTEAARFAAEHDLL